MKVDSPLRYPGSKATFAPAVKAFVNACGYQGFEVVEPFAGGGSVSLSLLSSGACSRATLIEKDVLLFAFWHSVFFDTNKLCEAIFDVDVTLESWHALRPLLDEKRVTKKNRLQIATAALFFNRTNFSGVLHAGPIGGYQQKSEYKIDCRFNKDEIVRRILRISDLRDRVSVVHGDALEHLEADVERENKFYYIDPPYFVQGEKLYRHSFDVASHKRLAAALSRLNAPWLLSYDRHPYIELLYERFASSAFEFRYSSKTRKVEQEFLATNVRLPRGFGSPVQPRVPAQLRKRKVKPESAPVGDLFGLDLP
ncbi:DNA adenine methylase [Burkholderia sp. B21-007]|uniref:DNA adenine methylase n=1 Tax=Burkholderia sp. B21-007 TaxID=2890407 RepID=UPI001E617A0C|nr:DNA adenine methylase [Burkholderia sp. B21-007]UEP27062.1 DNA adenine methylase [Burkholderia sp. B21-007]